MTLILLAKQPIPGKVKTRLHPPLSLAGAAEVATAAIADTVAAIADIPAAEHVLAYDGDAVPSGTAGYRLLPQIAGDLDERLAAIFDAHADRPLLLIGMDTPQLTALDLAPVFEDWHDGVDAWFGPASDGGFWALGMREPRGDLIRGIRMSHDDTGDQLLARLRSAGLGVEFLATLTDVDDIASAVDVADLMPDSRFTAALETALTVGAQR